MAFARQDENLNQNRQMVTPSLNTYPQTASQNSMSVPTGFNRYDPFPTYTDQLYKTA
jgi:hypothetical protein